MEKRNDSSGVPSEASVCESQDVFKTSSSAGAWWAFKKDTERES